MAAKNDTYVLVKFISSSTLNNYKSFEEISNNKNKEYLYICNQPVKEGEIWGSPNYSNFLFIKSVFTDKEEADRIIKEKELNSSLKTLNLRVLRTSFKPNNKEVKVESKTLKQENNMATEKKTSFMTKYIETFKKTFIPTKEESVKLTMQGTIAVKTGDTYVSIDQNNELISYEESFVFDFPMFSINVPYKNVEIGSIIKRDNKFYKVLERKDQKIKCLSFTGTVSTKSEVKSFVLNTEYIPVIWNFNSSNNTNINPMMFMFLQDSENLFSDMLPFLMMSNNNMSMNNMLPFLLMGKEGSMEDMLLPMMLMNNQNGMTNPFENLFGFNKTVEEPKKDNESEVEMLRKQVEVLTAQLQNKVNSEENNDQ